METELVKKLKEVQCSCSDKSLSDIQKFFEDLNRFRCPTRSVLIAAAQSLQGLLQNWSSCKNKDVEPCALGHLCVRMTTFVLMQLLTISDISQDDSTKAMKVLSFTLINAIKMVADVTIILEMLEASTMCFCSSLSLGQADIRGKCSAHHTQCIAQLANKLRMAYSTSGNQHETLDISNRIGICLQSTMNEYAVNNIDQGSLSTEEKTKLQAFLLDATFCYSTTFIFESSIRNSLLLSSLIGFHRYSISFVKAFEQVSDNDLTCFLLVFVLISYCIVMGLY